MPVWSHVTLLKAATAVGVGKRKQSPSALKHSFQAAGQTTTGKGSVKIIIEVSNFDDPNDEDYIELGVITLALSTTRVTDGFVVDVPWFYVRARVSAIKGTGANVDVEMGG